MNQLATIDLAPVRHTPRLARTFAAESLARWSIGAEDVEVLRLVVSELVTNAVRHAPASRSITLELWLHDGVVRVMVSDGSTSAPERGDLTTRTAEGGRGVELVDALADRWGSEHRRGGKTVWCELRASPRVEVLHLGQGPRSPARAGHAVGSSRVTGRAESGTIDSIWSARRLASAQYDDLGSAHRAVREWCLANGYEVTGTRWEIYGDWKDDPAELETEVYYLLR